VFRAYKAGFSLQDIKRSNFGLDNFGLNKGVDLLTVGLISTDYCTR